MDMTMCNPEPDCKMKIKCYRFTGITGGQRQSWCNFMKSIREGRRCHYYVDNHNRQNRKELQMKIEKKFVLAKVSSDGRALESAINDSDYQTDVDPNSSAYLVYLRQK